jgi:hypothetical protein
VLVDDVLAAPAGVALLARLEAEVREDGQWWEAPAPTADGVAAAVAWVHAASVGELLGRALDAAAFRVGPWIVEAPGYAASAYLDAAVRRPIAEAVVERFGARLEADLDVERQQLWRTPSTPRARFSAYDRVYCCGEFPWDAERTVTDPPAELHDELTEVWEMRIADEPVTRWRLPVRPGARVHEIHRPDDWASLVARFPHRAPAHGGWELPGPNQHAAELGALLAVPGQRAARTGVAVTMPDWAAVAEAYDGVHLSWAGFLTAEGCVVDLPDGSVTMLRYWASERTFWLHDAFGDPQPF